MTTEAQGLGCLFTATARERWDQPAVVIEGVHRTFGELEEAANRLARWMGDAGVGPQDMVPLCRPQGFEFFALVVACWKAGATPLPLSGRLPEAELQELLSLASPSLVVDGPGVGLADVWAKAEPYSVAPLPDVPSQPWKAIASGGSTGRSKLIVDRAGRAEQARAAARTFMLEPGMRHLVAGPLYHNGPFLFPMLHLLSGGTLVVMERFDAARFVEVLEDEAVGWAFVVPTMLHRIAQLPPEQLEGRRFPSLRVLLHSAAPCPAWLKRRTIDIFGAERVHELYGATELGGTMIRGDEWLAHPGSVGKPTPPTEIRILDEKGGPLPPGEVGEIWIKPPAPPTSTYRGASMRERDGFYSVGDLGSLDADGYLFIADRRTDLIISGGVNVYPAEVEAALLSHPDVMDVVVLGLADPEWGRRVHAVVELRPGATPDGQALDRHARAHVAPAKVPRSWEFVDAVPRDPSGKVRRSAMRDEREARPLS